MVPNRERHAWRIGDVPAGSPDAAIVTLGKDDERWTHVLTLPNLVEVTLHEPTQEQLAAMGSMQSVKRLRITHARPKTVDFIRSMHGLEEVVLEYVSGFKDMAPLSDLENLRSLHVENLRGVSDFGGLAGASGLKYLAIHGTMDWQQPIDDFEFLRGLSQLEVIALWEVKCRAASPALLPATTLRRLERVRIHASYLDTRDYALLEEGLAGVAGADWGPYARVARSQMELPGSDVRSALPDEVIRSDHPEVSIRHDGRRLVADPASEWFEFTGRGAGRVKCSSPAAEARCREQAERYEDMKLRARELLRNGNLER